MLLILITLATYIGSVVHECDGNSRQGVLNIIIVTIDLDTCGEAYFNVFTY